MPAEITEICDVCDHQNDIRFMHRVEVNRVVGSSRGYANTNTRGMRNSSSFGASTGARIGSGSSTRNTSRSLNRTDKVRERVWICNDCKPPRDAIIPFTLSFRTLFKLAVLGAIVMGIVSILPANRHQTGNHRRAVDSDAAASAPATPYQASEPSHDTATGALGAIGDKISDAVKSEVSGNSPRAKEGSGISGIKAETAASIIADPHSVDKVDAAMAKAFTSGVPERWHAEKLHGYAVPSELGANGCRMIQVSVDETGEKSSPVQRCS